MWNNPDPEYSLSMKYECRIIIESIRRQEALLIWKKFKKEPNYLPLDEALFTLDLFTAYGSGNIDNSEPISLREKMDNLGLLCRERLCLESSSGELDVRDKIIVLYRVMRENGIIGTTGANYYSLKNNFVSEAFIPYQGTLPIVLVGILIGIARRCGIDIKPVAFPGHVLACLMDKENDKVVFYIDPYREVIIETSEMESMLLSMGSDFRSDVALPVTTALMLRRCCNNVRDRIERRLPQGYESCLYAQLTLSSILMDRYENNVIDLLYDIVNEVFPLDEDLLNRGILGNSVYSNHNSSRIYRDDIFLIPPKRRTSKDFPKFMVGQVFMHKKYGYYAVITGWTFKCLADPEWIESMGVSQLHRGCDQPFYSAYSSDGTPYYTAEDNIELANDGFIPVESFLKLHDIGKFFKTYDYNARRFILTPYVESEYVDDIV